MPAARERADERRGFWHALRLDPLLAGGIALLVGIGLVILYSAAGGSVDVLERQGARLAIAVVLMLVLARIPAEHLCRWSPWLFAGGFVLLVLVLLVGDVGKGAQRWLDLGVVRFQPSEIMKLAVPMMVAWYFADRTLPPRLRDLAVAGLIVAVPAALIAKQPDLGTALLVGGAGVTAIFLAGVRWRVLLALIMAGVAALPLLWNYMHDYQRDRVLTMLDPERDPLGTGYHIIQSKIAVGSGGLYGKGWLNGTQSQLDFLPERMTDFIFAVFAEEFGFFGAAALLAIYAFIILRGLYIASRAQDTYSRLLAGTLSLTFFIYLFVNIGMVIGLLPVVGVPLPLVSYGGTSMVTLFAAFGMLMSIHSNRKLLAQ